MPVEKPTAKEIFWQALEVESLADREAYLNEACQGDAALRSRVQRLLAAQARSDSLLVSPVAYTEDSYRPSTTPGTMVGPYKIREQIGEGGMGEVYVAEQTEPVRRKVALKIIRPGMATKDVIARFEAERQALAMMDHPNIAKVFDGGITDDGPPFFVMELVQGIPIIQYCDDQRLSTRQRLELFLKVCRAVQHAHQKGIIHRDLKPSNILVAEIDAAAVPKVIDFGVAKAIDQKLTEQTVYTQFSQLVGTPLYMSPEQAGLGVIDIDTRSDVYSLGVLLYELLTGSTPFDRETLKRADHDELRRIIREDQPRRPSAMVSTLAAEALSTVAERRGSDPRTLSSALRGELDWLVMKALEKDRDRRYESAAALAEDVERYLADQPVLARPPSAAYRVRKFVRRNRALVASMAAILVALTAGLALATAGFVTAERRLAETTKVIELLGGMYPKPWGEASYGRNYTVYDAIEEASPKLDTIFADHRGAEVEVRQIFGEAYFAAGDFGKAREHLQRALELAVQEYGEMHETVAELHAVLADEVGWNYDEPHNYARFLEHAESAIEIFEALDIESKYLVSAWFAKGHCLLLTSPERRDEAEAAQRNCVEVGSRIGNVPVISMWDLGLMLMDFGDERLADAEAAMRKAIANYDESKHPPMHGATAWSGLGECLRRRGDMDGAVDALRKSWAMFQSDDDLMREPRAFRADRYLTEALFVKGDVDEAFHRLDELADESMPPEARVNHLHLQGWLYYQLEDHERAEEQFRRSMDLAEQHLENNEGAAAWACAYLGMSLESQGNHKEAIAPFQKLQSLTAPYVDSPYVHPTAYWAYAHATLGSKDGEEGLASALDAAERARDFVHRWGQAWQEPAYDLAIAEVHARRGDNGAAMASLQSGLSKAIEPHATWRAVPDGVPTVRRELEIMQVDLHLQYEQVHAAIQVLQKGVDDRREALGDSHFQVAMAQLRLGEFLVDQSDREAAEQPLKGAHRMLEPHSDVVNHLRLRAAARLVEVYDETNQPEKAAEWRAKVAALDQSDETSGTE